MTGRESFFMAEEFAGADFNEERPAKRFVKTMKTPGVNIYTCPAGPGSTGKSLRTPG